VPSSLRLRSRSMSSLVWKRWLFLSRFAVGSEPRRSPSRSQLTDGSSSRAASEMRSRAFESMTHNYRLRDYATTGIWR
jgi:hypothetical protein